MGAFYINILYATHENLAPRAYFSLLTKLMKAVDFFISYIFESHLGPLLILICSFLTIIRIPRYFKDESTGYLNPKKFQKQNISFTLIISFIIIFVPLSFQSIQDGVTFESLKNYYNYTDKIGSAAANGQVDKLKAYAQKHRLEDFKSTSGYSLYEIAILYDQLDVIKFLDEQKFKIDDELKIVSVFDKNNSSIIEYILMKHLSKLDVPFKFKTSREIYISELLTFKCQLFELKRLLDEKYININQGLLLHYAVKGGCLDIVILLMERGIDFNKKDIYGRTAAELSQKMINEKLKRASPSILKYIKNN